MAAAGSPSDFKRGSRCVDPLAPRYVLPGTGPSHSPTRHTVDPHDNDEPLSPSRQPPLVRPPWATAFNDHERAAFRAARSPVRRPPGPSAPASPAPPASPPGPASPPSASVTTATPGALGGLLLYGPGSSPLLPSPGSGSALASGMGRSAAATAALAAAAAGHPRLDVADINGPRKSFHAGRRVGSGFDPLFVADIVVSSE
jgi:hypothetical protein